MRTSAYGRWMDDDSRRDDARDSEQIRDLEPGVRDTGAGVGDYRPGDRRTTILFAIGAILAVIGLIGVAVYAFMPRTTPVEGDAQADAALQAGVIIGSAVALGIGALLLARAFVLRRRGQRG